MIFIKGYERKTGDFTPVGGSSISYDNVIFHLLNTDCSVSGFVGASCEQLKVKVKDLPNLFGCDYDSLHKFIDAPINLDYALVNCKPVLSKVVVLDNEDEFTFVGDR